MKKSDIKNYHFILGVSILLVGILFITLLSGLVRYLGIVMVSLAILYIASLLYAKSDDPDDETFRSPTREKILKRQYKK